MKDKIIIIGSNSMTKEDLPGIEFVDVLGFTLGGQVVKATRYISPTLIIRCVRKLYGKKIVKGNIEITLTVGKPNYMEREFIKKCKKAGEPFPVKKIQLKIYNPKKNETKR